MKKIIIPLLVLMVIPLTSCYSQPGMPETIEMFGRYEVNMNTFQMVGLAIIVVFSGIMIGITKWWDSKKNNKK